MSYSSMEDNWVFQPLWEKFGVTGRVCSHSGSNERGEWEWEKLLEDHAGDIVRSRFRPDTPSDVHGFKRQEVLLSLADDSFLVIQQGIPEVFSSSPEKARQLLEDLEDRYFIANQDRKLPGFHLIHMQTDYMSDTDMKVDYLPIRNAYVREARELGYFYGNEMEGFDRQLKENMCSQPTGIAFLHGEPGTGKTSYIRHLIHALQDTHEFYIISIPDFYGFLQGRWYVFWREKMKVANGRKIVLIVEDAEMHIETNEDGIFWRRSPVTSEFLQVADGLMGDTLRLQLIITTNLKLDKIDPALTRMGRLLGYRAFRSLSHLEAHNLSLHTGKKLNKKQESWTLAEIMASDTTVEAPKPNQRPIGFLQQNLEV